MGWSSLSSQQRIGVLLELVGGPQFSAQMIKAATATNLFGKSAEGAGRRTFFANQALYTLRRYSFFATTAVIGLTAVVGKLGYSYLSAMQTARVALGPVIKDHAVLEGYLNRLFQISKYSPFVITDLALSFRKMVGGFTGTGVGPATILTTISSLTDYLSVFGKVGPGSLNRVTQALIHMANVGRLTGRAVLQLGSDGLPIYDILNKKLGITRDQLKNIAGLNIPASSVLAAINSYAKGSKLINNAALRISLGTFSGLMQVARDSISQLSGAFINSTYNGGQGWLLNLVKKGGPLDRLSTVGNKQGGAAAILLLSKQLTGGTGLGKGFLLLLSTLQNVARVFVHVVIPGWVMGMKVLIVFYPILKAINFALGLMAKHATVLKFVIAGLAAEFFFTHMAVLLVWAGLTLFKIATLGAVRPVFALINSLRALAAAEWLAAAPFVAIAAATAAAIIGIRKLDQLTNNNKRTQFKGGPLGTLAKYVAKPGEFLLGRHAAGGFTGGGVSMVGEHGPELAMFPRATQIIPSHSVSGALGAMGGFGGGNDRPIVVQLVVDRKVLAEAVARHEQDVQGRR